LPAGEAGPSACSARANTNARARFPAGDGLLLQHPKNLELVSFAVNSRATASIGPTGLGLRPPGPPLAALAGMTFTTLSAIYPDVRSPGSSRSRRAGRSDTGRRRSPGGAARERARRDVIATARIRGRRPGQIYWPAGVTRSSTARYLIHCTLRWRNHTFCAAGAWWGSVTLAVHPFEQQLLDTVRRQRGHHNGKPWGSERPTALR
jgi:hypothetical protein